MSSILDHPFKIGDMIARLPIVQGGMGVGISLSGLASAVANEGGVGIIATPNIGMYEPDFETNYLEANIRALRSEIRKARKLTRGILGVNIMVALTIFENLVRTAIEEGIDVIFSGAGLPLDLPKFLPKNSKTKLVPIVSSGRAAWIISKKWKLTYDHSPDAIVVEGPKAGGHLGFKEETIFSPAYALEILVPEAIKALEPYTTKDGRPIPVIAAGGIYTGEDIYNFFQLGAAGVQMATRFVTTHECDASEKFKLTYINSQKEDLRIVKSPVGMPGRAIRNKFLDDVSRGEKKPFDCPFHCLKTCDYENTPYCISLALANAKEGKMEDALVFAGENAYQADKIISVHELVETLKEEYRIASTI
jgi:nitronate monooxygenase